MTDRISYPAREIDCSTNQEQLRKNLFDCAHQTAKASEKPVSPEPGVVAGLKNGETVALTTLVDGKSRQYWVHLPKDYDGSKPVPIYFVYHGFYSSPAAVEQITQFSAKADQENFIVVYPEGADYGHSFNNEEYPFKRKHDDDVKFSQSVYDNLTKNLNVDTNRVYAVGFSNGGSFVHTLVNKMPGKFAAVADVEGWMTGKEEPSKLPISELSIHGTDDPIVPLHGTKGLSKDAIYQLTHGLFHRDIPSEKNYPYGAHLRHKLGQLGTAGFEQLVAILERNTSYFEPTKYTTDFYTKLNGITETPCIDRQGNYVSTQYLDPGSGNEVRSIVVNGLAHKWPGGPKGQCITDGSGNEKSATDIIVDEFASKHQLSN
jgi:poly(3-hydroxybutyrate) depolymerase